MDGLKLILSPLMLLMLLVSCQKSENSRPSKIMTTRAAQTAENGPFDYQMVAKASVSFDRLELRTRAGKFSFVLEGLNTLQLLELRNDLVGVLKELSIPAGDYDLIRLYITEASIDLKDGRHFPMTVPSGAQSGLKVFVSPAISIVDKMKANLALAFDLRRSFKPQSSDNGKGITGFNFRPVIKATNKLLEGGGVLHGIVLNDDGTPMADANITILKGSDIVATTVTQEDGTYEVIGLPDGKYTVATVKDGFEAAENTQVEIISTADTEVNFELSDNTGEVITDIL
jgi:hypothetical protein